MDLSDPANPVPVGQAVSPLGGASDEDWLIPVGNLVIVGDDEGAGTRIIPHQAQPDTRGPSVNMVHPEDGATDQLITSRVGITLTDMIELGSIDETTFIVRPLGGTAVSGRYSHQYGAVNFTPDVALTPNTTYEVVVPAGGMRDWAGNGVEHTFSSQFTTSEAFITVTVQGTGPVEPGVPVDVDVLSVIGPGGPYQYSWDFGDGSPPTPFSSTSSATHVFAEAGHNPVLCTVTDGEVVGTDSYLQTVHNPLTAGRPTRSSTIILTRDDRKAMSVNTDSDNVTATNATSLNRIGAKVVGDRPRTLAQAPDDTIWIVCEGDDNVHVIADLPGAHLGTIQLPAGSAPYGIAMSPDGSAAYVTLRASGQVAKLDPQTRTLVETVSVGRDPRGIAISADSQRIFVTRFVSSGEPSPLSGGAPKTDGPTITSAGLGQMTGVTPTVFEPLQPVAEVYELSAATFSLVRTIPLHVDPGPDTSNSGRGLPNYLGSPAISPDGLRMWVPSKKDNIGRGLFRSGEPLTFESTVRPIVSQIELATSREDLGARIDFDDRDMAVAVAFSPFGDYTYNVLQGSNAIEVRDAYDGALVASVDDVGLAPQGVAATADGSKLFVQSFMSRTIHVFDVSGISISTNFAMSELTSFSAIAFETLPAPVLLGKQIFYNRGRPAHEPGRVPQLRFVSPGGRPRRARVGLHRSWRGLPQYDDAARQVGRVWPTATCTGPATSTRSRTSRTTSAGRSAATGS